MNYPGLKSGVSKLSPLPGLTATLPPWGAGMHSAEAAWFFHRTKRHTIRRKSTGDITTPDFRTPLGDTKRTMVRKRHKGGSYYNGLISSVFLPRCKRR